MASGPENRWRKKLEEAARERFGTDLYVQKNAGGLYSSGLPDSEYLLRGRVSWLELKAAKQPKRSTSIAFNWSALRPLQASKLLAIHCAGGNAAVLVFLESGPRACLMYRVPAPLAAHLAKLEASWTTLDFVQAAISGRVIGVSGPPKKALADDLRRLFFGDL